MYKKGIDVQFNYGLTKKVRTKMDKTIQSKRPSKLR